MNQKNIISIILPFFNAEKYLTQAIQSVLEQSFENWELILINDGSTDNSAVLAKSFTDERIRHIEQKNQGVANARNAGLNIATGDLICFLDADDTFPKNSLKSRVNLFKDPKISFVDGQVLIFNEKDSAKRYYWQPSFDGNPLLDLAALTGKSFLGITWMIRKSQIRNVRFKTGMTHAEDLLFLIEISSFGGYYSFTDETILNYRKGHTSAMDNLGGLRDGYKVLYNEIKEKKLLPDTHLINMKKKLRSIIFKSFVGKGQLIPAIQSLYQW